MIKFFSSLLLILASFSTMAAFNGQHLTFSEGRVHAHISWEVGPEVEKESALLVEFKTSDHKPMVIKSDLKVVLFMPDMGHGSSPTKAKKISESTFKVSKVFFTMPGVWEVRLSLKNEDGTKETKVFTVQI